MPPKFEMSEFYFEYGEVVPEHVMGSPYESGRDTTKWWLEESNFLSGDSGPIAVDFDDAESAKAMALRRVSSLEMDESIKELPNNEGYESALRTVYVRPPSLSAEDLARSAESTLS